MCKVKGMTKKIILKAWLQTNLIQKYSIAECIFEEFITTLLKKFPYQQSYSDMNTIMIINTVSWHVAECC